VKTRNLCNPFPPSVTFNVICLPASKCRASQISRVTCICTQLIYRSVSPFKCIRLNLAVNSLSVRQSVRTVAKYSSTDVPHIFTFHHLHLHRALNVKIFIQTFTVIRRVGKHFGYAVKIFRKRIAYRKFSLKNFVL
jgi:hypothetical protein